MFRDCKTLEELKKAYHAAAFKNHPDKGGSVEMMKEINNAYDKYFPLLKNKHVNKDGKAFEKETEETPEEFKDIIARLLNLEGLYIEIIGCFVWVSGETKPHKDTLKEMGFKWHSKKLTWYLAPEGYKRFGKKQYDLDEIRGMYGSTGFQAKTTIKLEAV